MKTFVDANKQLKSVNELREQIQKNNLNSHLNDLSLFLHNQLEKAFRSKVSGVFIADTEI